VLINLNYIKATHYKQHETIFSISLRIQKRSSREDKQKNNPPTHAIVLAAIAQLKISV
jgi:hypothetical protein